MALFSLAVVAWACIGAALALFAFLNLTDSQTKLSDHASPAAIGSGMWDSALHDQLTGAYAYSATGDVRFLEDYEEARARGAEVESEVRAALEEHPDYLVLVDDVSETMENWRSERAQPAIDRRIAEERTSTPDPQDAPDSRILELRATFDVVELELAELQDALADKRSMRREVLDRRTNELLMAVLALTALGVISAAATWLMVKRWVLDPLSKVSDATRTVAAGDLSHEVIGHGPPELEGLGLDIEAMRLRILDELSLVQHALGQLERQAEDLGRSNSELEQFAYVASHDLQEPLRKVTGFCQLLQRRYQGQLDERADEYIEYAVDGAKRMQLLINDLLAFSRVGRTTERFEQVDLNLVMTTVVHDLAQLIDEAGATVEVGDLPTVWGDPRLLHSLVVNLTGNALKFRGEAPPRVAWTAEQVDDQWELRCTDNGIGIEPKFADKVFEIFQRLHNRGSYPGTGIGLAMARKVVEFHGGRIWIDTTEPGVGTTMVFTIPVAGSEVPPDPSDMGHLAGVLGLDRNSTAAALSKETT